MSDEGAVSQWLARAKDGDMAALNSLCCHYFELLVRVAQRRLEGPALRLSDGDDVANSALDSFVNLLGRKQFDKLDDREALWKLLITITVRKCIDYNVYARRAVRGGGAVVGECALDAADGSGRRGLEQFTGKELTPEMEATLTDQYQYLLGKVDQHSTRPIVERRLQGFSNAEIAKALDVSERTVQRKLELARALWHQEFESHG